MMRISMLALFPLVASLPAHASDPCQDALIRFTYAAPGEYSARPDRFPYAPDAVFDLEARAKSVLQSAGIRSGEKLYSCRMNEGGSFCLQARPAEWVAHGADPVRLTAQEKSLRIELKAESHHFSGGDPWYGIGSKSWTNELRLTFDPKALTLSSLEIDRSNTTLGFGSRTRKAGTCVETSASALLPVLTGKLGETLIQSLQGRRDSRGGALDAQVLLQKNGTLIQLLPPSTPDPILEVVDLEKGTRQQTSPERLSGLRILRVKTLLESLDRRPSPLSEAALSEGPLTLNCIHPDAREIRRFTSIRLERSRIAPGSDLGYQPLARATLIRAGALSGNQPVTLPFGSVSASIVRAGNGSTVFIAPGNNGARTSAIHFLSEDEAKQRFNIPFPVIAFENTVCLLLG